MLFYWPIARLCLHFVVMDKRDLGTGASVFAAQLRTACRGLSAQRNVGKVYTTMYEGVLTYFLLNSKIINATSSVDKIYIYIVFSKRKLGNYLKPFLPMNNRTSLFL